MRGLWCAIIDDADRVLIDEARLPLVISRGVGDEGERRRLAEALAVADELREDRDFRIDATARRLGLTRTRLRASLARLGLGRFSDRFIS